MATGYTEKVRSGEITEFREFAMLCARAFGALITMCDEPMDAPIPDSFEPYDWNSKRIADAHDRLAKALSMTDEQAETLADEAYQKALTSYREQLAKNAETRSRYEAMLEQAQAWQPPTSDHTGLKTFMIEQLEESLRFDLYEPTEPLRQTGAEYKAAEINDATRDIAYHTKHHKEEVQRAKERTAWVQALRQSLKSEPSDA